MRFVILDRQQGKTTQLVEWVKRGQAIDAYPFWSRVLVTTNMQRADRLRGGDPQDPGHPTGLRYQQVFYIDEFLNARNIHPVVEVGLDDADDVLQRMFPGHRVSVVTASGEVNALEIDEIDRCARAYGWEIANGKTPEGPNGEVVISEKNPFKHPDWRYRIAGFERKS